MRSMRRAWRTITSISGSAAAFRRTRVRRGAPRCGRGRQAPIQPPATVPRRFDANKQRFRAHLLFIGRIEVLGWALRQVGEVKADDTRAYGRRSQHGPPRRESAAHTCRVRPAYECRGRRPRGGRRPTGHPGRRCKARWHRLQAQIGAARSKSAAGACRRSRAGPRADARPAATGSAVHRSRPRQLNWPVPVRWRSNVHPALGQRELGRGDPRRAEFEGRSNGCRWSSMVGRAAWAGCGTRSDRPAAGPPWFGVLDGG